MNDVKVVPVRLQETGYKTVYNEAIKSYGDANSATAATEISSAA